MLSYTRYLACSISVNITLSFGGKAWPISEHDINLGPDPKNPSQCMGAIFDGGTGSGSLTWIIGDTFLVSSLISRKKMTSLRFIET